MKQGRTLQELATEINRQKFSKRDFVAPATLLKFSQSENGAVGLDIKAGTNFQGFKPNDTFHDQLSEYLKIRRDYYRRMETEAPELLVQSVNTWLAKKDGEKRMVRTLDGNARAFLSDKFRPLDNYDLAETVLPILHRYDLEVKSCEVTEKRMFLKVVTPKISGEVTKGDVLHFGLSIKNSEIGYGSLGVELMVYRLVCLNGLIGESVVRKYHVGSKQSSGDGSWELFSDETKKLSDKAYWAQVKDVVEGSVKNAAEKFDGMINKMKKTTQIALPAPVEAVELVSEKYGLSDTEKSGVLDHLIKGGDLSLWGLTNAVTAYAQDKDLSYERATEFEQIGGKIIELSAKDFTVEEKVA